MSYLFAVSVNSIFEDFNGDISMWNVSNVKNTSYMFDGCKKFNCDLSTWNVSNVKYMTGMFYACKNFSCDLSKWDVSNVKEMGYAFDETKTTPDWYWFK
jgi:surface protein